MYLTSQRIPCKYNENKTKIHSQSPLWLRIKTEKNTASKFEALKTKYMLLHPCECNI